MAVRSSGKHARRCGNGCLPGPFLDGELVAGEEAGYRRHLAGCPDCRAELRTLRRLSQLLRAWGRPGPWETGPEDVLAAEPARERRAERLAPNPVGTTNLVILAVAGWRCGRE